MPIYAFECAACGHSFDRLQKLADPDPAACPECGAEQVRRQLTAPQFRLAGGGWYETDFKKDGDKKRNIAGKDESAAKPDATPDGKTATSLETKPTIKPEAKPSSSTGTAS
jgi:putative FmdB family regulatory protein